MVTDRNLTYSGDDFVMYTIIEPLCCTTSTNILLYSNFGANKTLKFRPQM